MKFTKYVMTSLLMMNAVAFAGGTQIGSGNFSIKCRSEAPAEFAPSSYFDVEVFESQGKLMGRVNGVVYNQDIQVDEYEVKASALKVSVRDDAYHSDELNDGEKRLVAMKSYLEDDEIKDLFKDSLKITFDLSLVKRVRLYDLDGNSKTNKFGGVVLVEAFDQSGNLLGRLFSSMIPGGCN